MLKKFTGLWYRSVLTAALTTPFSSSHVLKIHIQALLTVVSDFSWPAASPHRAEIQAAASAACGQTAKLRSASSHEGVLSGSGSCAQLVATSLSHQYINVYKNKTFIIHIKIQEKCGGSPCQLRLTHPNHSHGPHVNVKSLANPKCLNSK